MASLQHPRAAAGHRSAFGLFSQRSQLDNAILALERAGFMHSDISVLFNDMAVQEKMGHENSTKAPEGATAGAASGVVIGSALGWLVGIGSLAIPGVGPFIAAGPIMAAIAGAGLAGTLGGIAGGLVGFGIPEYEAKRYETFVRDGGFLLSVHVDNAKARRHAIEILENAGAKSISTKTEERVEYKDDTTVKEFVPPTIP